MKRELSKYFSLATNNIYDSTARLYEDLHDKNGDPIVDEIYTRKRCTDYIMEVKRELTFMRDAAKEWREMQFNSNEYKKPTSLRGISGNQVR